MSAMRQLRVSVSHNYILRMVVAVLLADSILEQSSTDFDSSEYMISDNL